MLVLMLLQTVIINLFSLSSLKSATDCCQTEQQIQQDAWDSVHISLNNASTRNVRKCLKEQWPPSNSPDMNGMEITCLGSNTRSYFETIIRSPKQFLN